MKNFRDQNYFKAYSLMEKVMLLNEKKLQNFYKKFHHNFNLYPGFCNRVFWSLCLPRVEGVKNFSKDNSELLQIKKTYKNYIKFNIKDLISSVRSILYFFIWFFISIFREKRGKILVEYFILTDTRYKLLQQKIDLNNKNLIIPIFTKYSSPFVYSLIPNYNLLRLLKNKCIENYGAYIFWLIYLSYFKPRKIIIADDSGSITYSLVLAAKIKSIPIIALSHGQLPPNQPFAYGFKKHKKTNLLLFDKYYVWDQIFKEAMITYGTLYDSQIFISGWLEETMTKINYDISKKKYVLYAMEHIVCNRYASFKILKDLEKMGYEIIIKKRPQIKNYSGLEFNFKVEFVDKFSLEHLQNSFCVVGTGTTLMYEFSNAGIPVLSPKLNDEYNFNLELDLPFINYTIESVENSIDNFFNKSNVTNDIIEEFKI